MKTGIALALAGLMFLAGCEMGDNVAKVPAKPKWPGAAYHIAFDTQATKPNPAGVTIPAIKYMANPEALEKRATLVVRFDASAVKKDGPVSNQMVMGPVDVPTVEGTLPAEYMDAADKGLSTFLKAYCIHGKVKLTVAFEQARRCGTEQQAAFRLDADRSRLQEPASEMLGLNEELADSY